MRQKTLEGQRAAAAKGNHGGRPKVLDEEMIIFARALHDKGVPVPEIAAKLSSRPEERGQAPRRRLGLPRPRRGRGNGSGGCRLTKCHRPVEPVTGR